MKPTSIVVFLREVKTGNGRKGVMSHLYQIYQDLSEQYASEKKLGNYNKQRSTAGQMGGNI